MESCLRNLTLHSSKNAHNNHVKPHHRDGFLLPFHHPHLRYIPFPPVKKANDLLQPCMSTRVLACIYCSSDSPLQSSVCSWVLSVFSPLCSSLQYMFVRVSILASTIVVWISWLWRCMHDIKTTSKKYKDYFDTILYDQQVEALEANFLGL